MNPRDVLRYLARREDEIANIELADREVAHILNITHKDKKELRKALGITRSALRKQKNKVNDQIEKVYDKFPEFRNK